MNEDLRRRWADSIKTLRRDRGLSQATVGNRCGVDQCTVSRWERGTMIPGEENKIRLAELFSVDARDMFPLTLEPAAATATS